MVVAQERRAAILKMRREGKQVTEIAKELGIKVTQVSSLFQQALVEIIPEEDRKFGRALTRARYEDMLEKLQPAMESTDPDTLIKAIGAARAVIADLTKLDGQNEPTKTEVTNTGDVAITVTLEAIMSARSAVNANLKLLETHGTSSDELPGRTLPGREDAEGGER